jgi:hypothetical protein
MQEQTGVKRNSVRAVITAVALLLVALLLTATSAAPTLAQLPDPTPTPTDPTWRGYSAARDAIQEEHSVDLTWVQQYTYQQAEFVQGIDWGCIEEIHPNDVRPAYFGWIFRITSLQGTTYEARVSFDLSAVAVCDNVTEGAPAAGSQLPAPAAGAGATGGFELGGHVLNLGPNAIEAMQQSGMTWVKKQLRYNLGDGTGTAEFMIQDAHSKGFKILLGIVGEPAQMGDFDGYVQTYADFVGQVAALGADAIEVWNEPNIDREWPTGQVNGARYTEMLAAAYNAIKSSNPNTIVISGAPAPTGFFGQAGCADAGCNDDVFMQQMAQAGAAQYMDCVGLHYNEGIVSPATTSGDPRGEFPTYYFNSMLQRGYGPFGGLPVCWTELGYLSAGGFNQALPAAFAWAENVTVDQHASWLADAVARSAQSGRVRLLIIWNVNFERFDSDPMAGYAIIRPDGTCPACGLLGQVMGGS